MYLLDQVVGGFVQPGSLPVEGGGVTMIALCAWTLAAQVKSRVVSRSVFAFFILGVCVGLAIYGF